MEGRVELMQVCTETRSLDFLLQLSHCFHIVRWSDLGPFYSSADRCAPMFL